VPKLDISTAIQMALAITVLIGVASIWIGIRSIISARRLPFFACGVSAR